MTRFLLASLSLAATLAAQSLSTMKPEEIANGTAFSGEQGNFMFAIKMERMPKLFIDEVPGPKLEKSGDVWTAKVKLETGTLHSFHYEVDGKKFGGRTDFPAFGPDSYEQAGVPKGTLSEKIVHNSKIYPGLVSDYWIYVPAQYDASKPAAVMIWQDGQGMTARENSRSQIVFDNLTHNKKIPVMIHIFISPGKVGERAWRSIEYDTVDNTYPRFLIEEILPEVTKKYKLRTDGYSRAIAGNSSGGICAFNAAWQQPEQFTRVLSRIGSFTSIQWKPGVIDGGNVYPNKIRKEPKRNIRTWMQDGWNDLENNHGSWPLQNIQMANSLKMMNYDFHLSFGRGTHNGSHGNAELPEAMEWLWRDYDPAKTSQSFEQEAAEKTKPMFRVSIVNR